MIIRSNYGVNYKAETMVHAQVLLQALKLQTKTSYRVIPDYPVDPSSNVTIQGVGATFPNEVYQDSLFSYGYATWTSCKVTYLGVGSSKGQCRIKNASVECNDSYEPKEIDFAASDSLLQDEDYERYPDLQMFPVLGGAVVPIYNLGTNITDDDPKLLLDRDTITGIYLKSITHWNDTAIVNLNPVLHSRGKLPNAEIQVCVREDSSGMTQIFKKALAKFSGEFATRVGVIAFVQAVPNSIGYSNLGDALFQGVVYADMQQGDYTVRASPSSVEYAVLEKGLEFGNNGDDPSRLTADIQDARGAYAWPIASYTYVILRLNQVDGVPRDRLREGATCAHVNQTMAYLNWFLSADIVRRLAFDQGFSRLPYVVRDVVLEKLNSQVMCGGRIVTNFLNPANALRLQGEAAGPSIALLKLYKETYVSAQDLQFQVDIVASYSTYQRNSSNATNFFLKTSLDSANTAQP
eukprot:gene3185-4030_t